MQKVNSKIREPLFHISKRAQSSLLREIMARVIAFLIGLIVACLICFIVYGANPIAVLSELFTSCFRSSIERWKLFRDTALLLGVGLALIPAFKMKFWNLGGNGQILIGGLTTMACMLFLGGKLPDPVVWLLMLLSAVVAGALWAAIPAIFKAVFNTNESLFTLMMNYIAVGLVAFFIKEWSGAKSSGSLEQAKFAHLPQLAGNDYLLIIVVVAVICLFMFAYMKYSKHGFELSVVGDSENTAKYIGINVKKVVIRTLCLSGAICGIIGFLIVGAKDFSITTESAKNFGFVAIIAVWIAHMNPLVAAGSTFGIIFLTQGMSNVQTMMGVSDDSVVNMIIGIMYLCIIGCEFFIFYAIRKRSKKKNAIVPEEVKEGK